MLKALQIKKKKVWWIYCQKVIYINYIVYFWKEYYCTCIGYLLFFTYKESIVRKADSDSFDSLSLSHQIKQLKSC